LEGDDEMASYQAQIVQEVTTWEDVSAASHRFGGTEFNVGKVEIGHIHGSHMLDVPFTVKIREALVADGEAQEHHLLADSGWISFYLRKDDDVRQAIKLLRISYLQKRIRRVSAEVRAAYEAEIRTLAASETLKSVLLSKATQEEIEA
jgi:Ni,Fe-hydrogenase I large subunit